MKRYWWLLILPLLLLVWWGLDRRDATVTNNGVSLHVHGGRVTDDSFFHVTVPARSWWDDIAYT